MRFYVEVECTTRPGGGLEEAVDQLMDALLDEPGLLDADVLAELVTGAVTFSTSVDADDEAAAVRAALLGIRSAAHKAGANTPGWPLGSEGPMERHVTSVRPVEPAGC